MFHLLLRVNSDVVAELLTNWYY